MFSKATANFVRQIDPEGSLIHVSRVNDSHKLVPIALVVKRRIWFWQRPKYQPTDFTLSDLLQDEKVLSPGVSETEFLSYNGTFGDQFSGKLEAEAGSVGVTLEGRGTTTLQSSFGKLRREELDVKKLLNDSSNRLVDMQHVLVQQLKKRNDVLAVVKERILTTSSCTVTQTKKDDCTCQGLLGLVGMLGGSVKVCVKESNEIVMDSDVSLEIPPGTVIAYSILELEIKKNGDYQICLQPGTIGGFEDDTGDSVSSHDSFNTVDGNVPNLEMNLSPLAGLPRSTRRALFLKLQEVLTDSVALTYLQSYVSDLCSGETLNVERMKDVLESQKKLVTAILDCIGPGSGTENGQSGLSARLIAAHLLVSALEELPDETLTLLSKSRPDFLEAFDTLMCMLKESSQPLPIQSLPVPLQNNQTFKLAEQLLSSTSVTLRRDANRLWVETGDEPGVLPLVLCLSIHGLFLLCSEQK
ncbi:gasdermin-E-like [Scomber japonicus]|uniref:gasdermin-E-like n=1 Tax=Scomber japonicus TaxID=13676 RepID=UPI00230615B5|nr:gasdermin-E-like [Scomber japonicus]